VPFLPVDVDAKRKATKVAAALGMEPSRVMWALLELWEHVWREKDDHVGGLYLAACVGPDDRLREAFVETGFLEPVEGGRYRICGAKRWLLGMEGRSRGGHAAKKHLVPGAAHQPRETAATDGVSSAPAQGQPKGSSAGGSALHPEAQKPRSPEPKSKAEPPPPKLEGPRRPPEDPLSSSDAFWAEVQDQRAEHGLPREKPPHTSKLHAWWSEALMELNGDANRIVAAYRGYAKDPFWRDKTPPWPFHGFISQWRKYVPAEPVRAA
jgi:hypothetical protein